MSSSARTPVGVAERAVLGALLADPARVADVAGWLEPGDFADPRHAAAYTALLTLTAAQAEDTRTGAELDGPSAGRPAEPIGAVDGDPGGVSWPGRVAEQLARASGVRFGPGDPALLVVDLLAAPGHADRAAVYGEMVLEASVARAVTAEGTRLHQAATGPTRTGPAAQRDGAGVHAGIDATVAGLADRLDAHLDAARTALDQLQRRWSAAPTASTPHHVAPRSEGATAARPDPVAALPPSPPVRRPGRPDAAAEDAALGALLRAPGRLAAIAQWLRPGDFAAPGRGDLYAVLGDVHARGDPVDPVTVLWAMHRRDLLHAHPASAAAGREARPGPGWVLTLAELAPPGDPAVYAARVLAAAVTARAADTGLHLRRLPGTGLPPARLLPAARRLLTPLAGDTRRLRAATEPPQHVHAAPTRPDRPTPPAPLRRPEPAPAGPLPAAATAAAGPR